MDEWNDSPERRPNKVAFAPYGDLDALTAWTNFGGLSRNAAYEKFCQLPSSYQEDFMFMGVAAFVYYFPVVERYILESRIENGASVEAMWILAHCIKAQYEAKGVDYALRTQILELASHVLGNLAQYSVDIDEQGSIAGAWRELDARLRANQIGM
jgi:hypothetical protein